MRKNTGNWALPGVVFVGAFAMSAACGSEAPELSGSDCPTQENPSTTVSSTSAATTGAGGNTNAGATSTTSTSTSVAATTGASTGTGMEAPMYDVPAADEIASRLHACHKMTYAQLGNFLRNRGVSAPQVGLSDTKTTTVTINGVSKSLGAVFGGSNNACEMADTVANGSGQGNDPLCPSGEACFCNQDDKLNETNRNCLDVGNNGSDAKDGYCVKKIATSGFLYFNGKDALGVPKLDSRQAEKDEHSTASAMKLMDIFVQGASEIVANIGDPVKAPACTLNGKNQPMFDAKDGSCVEESVSCLIGQPASPDHMLLCNLIVGKANVADQTDVTKKRNLAVAVLLSAAHSCQ